MARVHRSALAQPHVVSQVSHYRTHGTCTLSEARDTTRTVSQPSPFETCVQYTWCPLPPPLCSSGSLSTLRRLCTAHNGPLSSVSMSGGCDFTGVETASTALLAALPFVQGTDYIGRSSRFSCCRSFLPNGRVQGGWLERCSPRFDIISARSSFPAVPCSVSGLPEECTMIFLGVDFWRTLTYSVQRLVRQRIQFRCQSREFFAKTSLFFLVTVV